jgi:hypothetical protein
LACTKFGVLGFLFFEKCRLRFVEKWGRFSIQRLTKNIYLCRKAKIYKRHGRILHHADRHQQSKAFRKPPNQTFGDGAQALDSDREKWKWENECVGGYGAFA